MLIQEYHEANPDVPAICIMVSFIAIWPLLVRCKTSATVSILVAIVEYKRTFLSDFIAVGEYVDDQGIRPDNKWS